jgi:FMN-dependent NADH-azoreductase
MPYLLSIEVSPLVESSTSRKVVSQFIEAYKKSHSGHDVVVRDLAANPLPHVDAEALSAAYVPEDQRAATMAAKHKLRLDLIKEIEGAAAVVIATPMYNWNIPSALKAYVDQIIMPGVFDAYGKQGLTGKPITIIYVRNLIFLVYFDIDIDLYCCAVHLYFIRTHFPSHYLRSNNA